MTAIVGIRCVGGLVLAADGAATLGNQVQDTGLQREMRKIALGPNFAIAAAGHVGLGQRLIATVRSGLNDSSSSPFTGTVEAVQLQMRNLLWRIIEPELRAVKVASDALDSSRLRDAACSNLLVACIVEDKAELIHFDEQGAPTLIGDEHAFQSIGSGQQFADPFLLFIRRLLWSDGLPSIATGVFSALWTVQHAIDVSSGGVSEPIQVAVIEKTAEEWSARELTNEQLTDHRDNVAALERRISDWKSGFVDPSNTAPIPPMKPPELGLAG